MDWPLTKVYEKENGKEYFGLFDISAVEDDDDSGMFDILRNRFWKMDLQDRIVVRGQGDDENFFICYQSYLVHVSSYFRSFLERWNEENADSIPEIKLENVSLDVFRNLLELSSSGELDIGNGSDFAEIVGGASFLQMEDLSRRFGELIREEMKYHNFSVMLWSYMTPEEYHGYVGLIEEASPFVKARFQYILATCANQLMGMSGKQWLDVISDPDTFVISEDLLFRTLCSWVMVDFPERSDDFVAVTKYVRGGCLSKELLAEFRDEPSTPQVIRNFVSSVSDLSQSQPRTIEVVTFLSDDDGGIVCFDPFARTAGSVSLSKKFDTPVSRDRVALVVSAENLIHVFLAGSVATVDPILDNWDTGIKLMKNVIEFKREHERIKYVAAYLDGYIYTSYWSKDRGFNLYKVECSGVIRSDCDWDSRSCPCRIDVPDYLRDLQKYSLIGHAGKIHLFSMNGRYTYDPSKVLPSEAWSSALSVIPPFEKSPGGCCVGPDGMIYIRGRGEKRLWIFNAATSEFRISAACTEVPWEVLNVENQIVCVVRSKENNKPATRVYDHVSDSWTERHETITDNFDTGDFCPVRLLSSSLKLFPGKSAE